MNDELKKIIKEIECYQNEDMCMIMLSQKENKALLDYITNLQQENKQFEKNNERLYKQDTNKIKDLKKELEIIQEKLQKSNQFGAYRMKECSDYKSRIEKAVEYIRTNEGYSQLSGMWEFYGDTDEIVKILRGEYK